MNYFFISKPIQYHTVRQIVFSEKKNNCVLIICNNFYNSHDFYKRIIKFDHFWEKILYFKSRVSAYLYLFFKSYKSEIYIDSDYGKDIILVWLMSFLSKKINLYEEGQFSYSNDLWVYYRNRRNKLVGLYEFLGFKKSLGSSKYISKFYIYDIEKFRNERSDISHKAMLISSGFYPSVETIGLYFDIFNLSPMKFSGPVLLYVGSKYFEELITPDRLVSLLGNIPFDLIFKPHPGANYTRKDVQILYKLSSLEYVESLIPVELLIPAVSCSTLDVIHHNSSVGMYYKFLDDNITLTNIENTYESFYN